jgi:hypothetical protein
MFHKVVIEVYGETFAEAAEKVSQYNPMPLIKKKVAPENALKHLKRGARLIVEGEPNFHSIAAKQGLQVSTTRAFMFIPKGDEPELKKVTICEIIGNDPNIDWA